MGWFARLFGRRDAEPADPSAAVAAALARMGRARPQAEAIRAMAIEDFGGAEAADRWLVGRVPFLGDRRPLDLLCAARGRAAVADTLTRLRHEIYP